MDVRVEGWVGVYKEGIMVVRMDMGVVVGIEIYGVSEGKGVKELVIGLRI